MGGAPKARQRSAEGGGGPDRSACSRRSVHSCATAPPREWLGGGRADGQGHYGWGLCCHLLPSSRTAGRLCKPWALQITSVWTNTTTPHTAQQASPHPHSTRRRPCRRACTQSASIITPSALLRKPRCTAGPCTGAGAAGMLDAPAGAAAAAAAVLLPSLRLWLLLPPLPSRLLLLTSLPAGVPSLHSRRVSRLASAR